jgi:hypothetical protein
MPTAFAPATTWLTVEFQSVRVTVQSGVKFCDWLKITVVLIVGFVWFSFDGRSLATEMSFYTSADGDMKLTVSWFRHSEGTALQRDQSRSYSNWSSGF